MRSVAIQGTMGSYSEEAAVAFFGSDAKIRGFSSFFETYHALLMKHVDYAVVPIKNSIIGEIRSAVSLLEQSDLQVLEELPLEIEHVLVGSSGSSFDRITRVTSHAAALDQCESFFALNPQITKHTGADTASSIRKVVEDGVPQNAAIGSLRAAKLYGGKILTRNIADDRINRTTFYLIENKSELRIC